MKEESASEFLARVAQTPSRSITSTDLITFLVINSDIPSSVLDALRDRIEICQFIDQLRETEGNSITINCENPDGNGPDNNAIDVCTDWTKYENRRFWGVTLVEALRSAYEASTPIDPLEP